MGSGIWEVVMEEDKNRNKEKIKKLGCSGCEYSIGPSCVYPGICQVDANGKCLSRKGG